MAPRGQQRLGHAPPFDIDSHNPLIRLLRPLLRLYLFAFYDSRPNTTDRKSGPATWDPLHSEWRHFQYFFCYLGPPSHILWNVKWPLAFCMLVALSINIWEQLGMPKVDPGQLAYNCFRLSSFAMSLILSVRISRAYDRWWQARGCFGQVCGSMTQLMMQMTTFVKDEALTRDALKWGSVWAYTIHQTIIRAPNVLPECEELLVGERERKVLAMMKPRQLLITKLRQIVSHASLGLPLDQSLALDRVVDRAVDAAGTCMRIRFTAMPYGLRLFSAGFIQIWLVLLPFGLSAMAGSASRGDDGWARSLVGLLPYFFTALMILGANEVASQLEDPFDLLPCTQIIQLALRDANRVFDDVAFLRDLAQEEDGEDADSADKCSGGVELPANSTANGAAEPAAAVAGAAHGIVGVQHVALKLA